ncbi:hypothetical protein MAR_023108 [Mya arenaria]|uniref:Uncharacterized protein n=1 Tax=Mya arenaria TaxID=6604 RepID=A0ABY7DUY1_MYAAR|nr:hypothetical protein MAR_023108 [Mya arenaria]
MERLHQVLLKLTHVLVLNVRGPDSVAYETLMAVMFEWLAYPSPRVTTLMSADRILTVQYIALKGGLGTASVHDNYNHNEARHEKGLCSLESTCSPYPAEATTKSIITANKTWVSLYDPETKLDSSTTLAELDMHTIQHPPYSSDQAPCYFWNFPTIKNELRDSGFDDVKDLPVIVRRHEKCVKYSDEYLEKL